MKDQTRREFARNSAASALEMSLLSILDTDSDEDRANEENEAEDDDLLLYGSVESSVDYDKGLAGVTIEPEAGPETAEDFLESTNFDPNCFDHEYVVPLEEVAELEPGSAARRLLDPNFENPSIDESSRAEEKIRDLHRRTEEYSDSEFNKENLQPISAEKIDDEIHLKISGLTEQPDLDDRNIFDETFYHGNSFDAWTDDRDAYIIFHGREPSDVLPEEEYVRPLSRKNKNYSCDQRALIDLLDAASIREKELSYPC